MAQIRSTASLKDWEAQEITSLKSPSVPGAEVELPHSLMLSENLQKELSSRLSSGWRGGGAGVDGVGQVTASNPFTFS